MSKKEKPFELGLYASEDGETVVEAFDFVPETGVVWFSPILLVAFPYLRLSSKEFKKFFPVRVTECNIIKNKKRKVLDPASLKRGRAYASEDELEVVTICSFDERFLFFNPILPVYDSFYGRIHVDDFCRKYPLEISGCVIEQEA